MNILSINGLQHSQVILHNGRFVECMFDPCQLKAKVCSFSSNKYFWTVRSIVECSSLWKGGINTNFQWQNWNLVALFCKGKKYNPVKNKSWQWTTNLDTFKTSNRFKQYEPRRAIWDLRTIFIKCSCFSVLETEKCFE